MGTGISKSPTRSNSTRITLRSLMTAPLTPSTGGSSPFRPPAPRLPMSRYSSPQVPDSCWSSENFMLGAGMVIIQPSTHRLVLIHDTEGDYWFLPKGRKDVGESLETAALREAYEESGYRVSFLPLFTPTRAPSPPSDPSARRRLNTESLYTTITHWSAGRGNRDVPGEYITFWYAGQIPHDAVHETGTGMSNEQTYTSHLLTYQEVLERLWGVNEKRVVEYVWAVYAHTLWINDEANKNNDVRGEDGGEDRYEDESEARGQDLISKENKNTSTSTPLRTSGTSSRTIVNSNDTQPPRRNPEPTRPIVNSRIVLSQHSSRPTSHPVVTHAIVDSRLTQSQNPSSSISDSTRHRKYSV